MLDVSRETMDRLRAFHAIVVKWNSKINLIARSTESDIWTRHIVDSAQIFDLAPSNSQHWADFGSGGGFPGMVVACIAAEKNPDLRVTLVESDQRKCAFLRTASLELGLKPDILTQRIEAIPPLGADVVSARALASLDQLCAFAHRHLSPHGTALFPKGKTADQEIESARQNWQFRLTRIQSKTDESACLLKLEDLTHA
jgi:16S rRNA (guanine527-N7)-methyltransferase